jgi:hypothetical protein
VTTPIKRPIPVTPLLSLYRAMRASSQGQRLGMAGELTDSADEVVARIAESIEQFCSYDNVSEPFCPAHAPLPPPPAIVNGRTMAAALQQSPQKVSGDGAFSFDVVDYEVPPARTTQKAALMLNRFTDGRPSTTTMAIDLLLRHEDGAVIIGEVKVAKAQGYDTDSVLALVQALAAATQFSTPPQQARLTRWYSNAFSAPMPLEVAVIAYHPPKLAAATLQPALDGAARALARALTASPRFPPEIRHIRFLRATGSPSNLVIVEA